MAPLKRARGGADLGVAAALLALFLVVSYGYALSIPFINDDYIFLDKTRNASFLSLWEPRALAFHWYRPISRELHYWGLQRLFGPDELAFHVASFSLAWAALVVFFALARRWTGRAAAAIATAGWAALAAWGVPLVWVAGAQELWMLVFCLLCLAALAAGRGVLAAGAFVAALLSKEGAAVLPAIVLAHETILARRPPREALRRTAPYWGIVAIWAALHPVLGGRLLRPLGDPLERELHPPFLEVLGRTLGVPLNVDALPLPESGWEAVLVGALPGALLLAGLVIWGARLLRAAGMGKPAPAGSAPESGAQTDRTPPAARPIPPGPARIVTFGLVWALAGWTPLLMPTLGWHAYYALLGSGGAWLALGVVLARRPGWAVALVTALALARGARADTPSRDWGSEYYQRRAASFIRFMRADLKRLHPRLPSHSRLYFVRVPSNVGFLAGDGPAVRVWYRDPTLRAGFYPSYRPRAATEPAGSDFFFRYDSTTGWVPVTRGSEDVAAARRANPRWLVDHEVLAQTLARGGDWPAAATEYVKLARAETLRVDFAYNAGVCYEALGDSGRAARWFTRAAGLPGADDEARERARQFRRPLPRTGARPE